MDGRQQEMTWAKLGEVMRQHDARCLWAVESGSRAWGIESPDSDWDVRFIYAHPSTWYLRLVDGRDTIEHPFGHMADNLDFQGFDLRKALRLAAKSNPSVLEWLHSPIVYGGDADFHRDLIEIMRDFSPRALMHHYVSLASRQYKAYWRDGCPVRFKKYLYAVRPLMCVYWMVNHDYQMPPMPMRELKDQVCLAPWQRDELTILLKMKAEATEIDGMGRFEALDGFITSTLEVGHDMANDAPAREPSIDALQELFWRIIAQTSEEPAPASQDGP